ncbi:MAG: hypothetical protein R3E77_07910 [Steroidobacteraceae bacterium]
MALAISTIVLALPDGLHSVALIVYGGGFGTITATYAIYQAARHPPRRSIALLTIGVTVAGLTVPFIIKSAYGGPVPAPILCAAVLLICACAMAILLSREENWLVGSSFRGKTFNSILALLLGTSTLSLWAVFAKLYPNLDPGAGRNAILGTRGVLSSGGWSIVGLAIIAFFAGAFAFFYAPIGLIRNDRGRVLHFAQLMLSLVAIATAGAVAFMLLLLLVNPG